MKPVSRHELIRRLRSLGFEGPFSGGKHLFMRRERLKLRIPNPHEGDLGTGLLKEIIKQAGISIDEWKNAE